MEKYFYLDTETLILVQIGIEMVLICLVGVLMLKFRQNRLGPVKENIDAVLGLTRESEKICRTLTANLNEKRTLAERLLSDIDARIHDLRGLSNMAEKPAARRAPARRQTGDVPHANILELSRMGLSVEEIAERLSLSGGEIEMVLGLARIEA